MTEAYQPTPNRCKDPSFVAELRRGLIAAGMTLNPRARAADVHTVDRLAAARLPSIHDGDDSHRAIFGPPPSNTGVPARPRWRRSKLSPRTPSAPKVTVDISREGELRVVWGALPVTVQAIRIVARDARGATVRDLAVPASAGATRLPGLANRAQPIEITWVGSSSSGKPVQRCRSVIHVPTRTNVSLKPEKRRKRRLAPRASAVYRCPACSKSFGGRQALAQHRKAKSH